MKKAIALILAIGVISGATILTFAASADAHGPYKNRVNRRQARQQARIGQGAASGSLTARETARLQAKEAALARKEARMRASGGGLTAKEHAKLEKAQDNLSQDIYKQKHDAQTRGGSR